MGYSNRPPKYGFLHARRAQEYWTIFFFFTWVHKSYWLLHFLSFVSSFPSSPAFWFLFFPVFSPILLFSSSTGLDWIDVLDRLGLHSAKLLYIFLSLFFFFLLFIFLFLPNFQRLHAVDVYIYRKVSSVPLWSLTIGAADALLSLSPFPSEFHARTRLPANFRPPSRISPASSFR